MVATPTLTASASSSAISASDKPESCCRPSAQNQTLSAPCEARSPKCSKVSRIVGRINAAPSKSAASTAKPATSELPNHSNHTAAAKAKSAAALWRISQRCCACCQACGCATARTGMRIALISAVAAAASAPTTEIASPAIHHSGLRLSSPPTGAP